jgi:hypothetical protein
MKSLKTFNLDAETIRIVRSKPNQSEYCAKAIRALHNKEKDFDVTLMSTKQLLVILGLRSDTPNEIKALINLHLYG